MIHDGSLDSQFAMHTKRQREKIYEFQRLYGGVRVTRRAYGAILVEGLGRGLRARVVAKEVVKPHGD